jgi:hypothetical protein
MKQLVIILLASLAFVTAHAGDLYKWVDNHGVVHYSDEPHKGAKKVDLPGLSRYSRPSAPVSSNTHDNTSSSADAYKQFEVVTPKSKQTIHANDGKVPVNVAMDPPLRQGEKLVYTLDDKRAGTSTSTSITLTNVVRGTHTLAVSAINGKGKTVARAPSVTFYVRHHSLLNKKNPASQFPKGPAHNNSNSGFRLHRHNG